MKIAVYPGSFDPITNGHLDVLIRSSKVFDKVIVLVAVNPNKQGRFTIQERIEMIEDAIKDLDNISVDYYEGLTVEYAKKVGAKHLIRGLRAVSDFEYEFQLNSANRFANNDIDMIFFMSNTNNSFINSSTIIELSEAGIDVSSLVPPLVNIKLKERIKK